MIIMRKCVLYLIVIIKSEIWPICDRLELGHETWYALYVFLYSCRCLITLTSLVNVIVLNWRWCVFPVENRNVPNRFVDIIHHTLSNHVIVCFTRVLLHLRANSYTDVKIAKLQEKREGGWGKGSRDERHFISSQTFSWTMYHKK